MNLCSNLLAVVSGIRQIHIYISEQNIMAVSELNLHVSSSPQTFEELFQSSSHGDATWRSIGFIDCLVFSLLLNPSMHYPTQFVSGKP